MNNRSIIIKVKNKKNHTSHCPCPRLLHL
jgi:hypothetical protein